MDEPGALVFENADNAAEKSTLDSISGSIGELASQPIVHAYLSVG